MLAANSSRNRHTTLRNTALCVAITTVMALTSCAMATWPGPTVMGPSRVSASDLTSWFNSKNSGGSATVPVRQLAQMFIEEGAAEGVAGDLAFVQAMLETGWLRFSARMPRRHNNFSGLGAVDSGKSSEAFPSARIGVRAQIQHLRAYADPKVRPSRLAHRLVDTRFHYVPKGRAQRWAVFGSGVWASSPRYGSDMLRLYADLLRWADARR